MQASEKPAQKTALSICSNVQIQIDPRPKSKSRLPSARKCFALSFFGECLAHCLSPPLVNRPQSAADETTIHH
jgi:hypothetical protein